jgi:hypothetical protein
MQTGLFLNEPAEGERRMGQTLFQNLQCRIQYDGDARPIIGAQAGVRIRRTNQVPIPLGLGAQANRHRIQMCGQHPPRASDGARQFQNQIANLSPARCPAMGGIGCQGRLSGACLDEFSADEIGHLPLFAAAAEVKNAAGATGSVQIDGRLDYESYRLSDKEPCVRMAAEAVRAAGREPELAVTNGGLDANWLVRHGIPTVSLGCGQLHPHMTSEALLVPDFEDACRIALRLATAAAPA